jgi:hypothetical protein
MGRDSLDRFVDQKRIVEEYTPYEENFGKFESEGLEFETFNINNDSSYNIKNKNQIKISLNFSGSKNKNAYLVNTAIAYNDLDLTSPKSDNIHYTDQINFLSGNKKIVSSNNFPTAYWNFNNNRWEYLDAKSVNISNEGFVTANGDENLIFPANIHDKQIVEVTSYDPLQIGYNFLDNVKNNLLNRPICFSPSFRASIESELLPYSRNRSFLMQPTTSHGFPQKYNWQPHNNHILKMSDYIDENFVAEKIIIKGKISANFEKPVKNGHYGNSSTYAEFQQDYPLKQLKGSYTDSTDTLGFTFFILNQRKNSDIINKSQTIPHSSFYIDANASWGGFFTSLPLAWYSSHYSLSNNAYSELSFLSNEDVSSKFTNGFLYEFANKNLDFYKIHSEATNKIILKENKNMFYYLDETSNLATSANRNTQFLYKNITDWSESNFQDDLTQNPDSMNIFNITSSYSNGVEQEEVSRELVTFSNLLFVNAENINEENHFVSNSRYKNIDKILLTSNNSFPEASFVINSNFKNYNKSNYIDESKYVLLSNKTESFVLESGSTSSFEFTLTFDYSVFSDSFSNFSSNLDNKFFRFKTTSSSWLEFRFKDDSSENNFLYFTDHDNDNIKGNYINLNNLSSNWSNSLDISDAYIRSYSNFNYFIDELSLNVFNSTLLNTLAFYEGTICNSSIGAISVKAIFNNKTNETKTITIKIEGKDNNTDISSQSEETNFSGNYSFSIKNNTTNVQDTTDVEILENNVNILEGFSKGSENMLGVNSERIVGKRIIENSKYFNHQGNDVGYSYYNRDEKEAIINTNYIIKPEDEFIFGINSYGNGDLIASMVELHDNLDIIIIGDTQSSIKRKKNFESKSIKKVIDSSLERKTNIEGSYLTKNNYFSKKYNTENFRTNKRLIGNSSSNKFGTWGGFVSLEEVDKSISANNNSKNATRKRYYYDSVLPNFIDIFSSISSKSPKTGSDNDLNFILDDYIDKDTITNNTNKSKVLFSKDWLNSFIFIDKESFLDFRNINNSINSSIQNVFGNSINLNSKFDIRVNENSYNFSIDNSGGNIYDYTANIYDYTKPKTGSSIHRLPLKIQNNTKYDFIKSDQNITIAPELLDNSIINFTVQKPVGFNKWILVIHDSKNSLENNVYPIYMSFRNYIEQGENDFASIIGKVSSDNYYHLVSKRSVPLTLHTTDFVDINGTPFPFFKSFSKNFNVYYSTQENQQFNLLNINTSDYITTNKTYKYYAELEYWEAAELLRNFSSSIERPNEFGGANSGFAYSESVYTTENDFANTLLKPVAAISKAFYDLVGADEFTKIYSLGETINNSHNFLSSSLNTICNLSISRYKIKNAESYDRPALENYLQDDYRFDNKQTIINTIQTYIDRKYLEDQIDKIKNVEIEFDKINKLSQDLILNEKIYESDVYYFEPVITNDENTAYGNMVKSDVKAIFKYRKDDNGLTFPYIDLLSMKSKSSLFNTKFNQQDSSIFLPKKGKIRIYEQTLLDIHNETDIIVNGDIPYFDISLHVDSSTGIDFSVSIITDDDLNHADFDADGNAVPGNFTSSSKFGSKIFSIKKANKEITSSIEDRSYLENILLSSMPLINPENHEEWESFEDRDRNINNFLYTFGNKHYKLPLKSCEGFKFGVFNGHKTSPSYKFNAYSYGQFADFVPYSTNAVFIKRESKTTRQIISFPVEKVFVDKYYNVVDTSSNTYNSDIYSSHDFPYIENSNDQLSQLNVNNTLYNALNAY